VGSVLELTLCAKLSRQKSSQVKQAWAWADIAPHTAIARCRRHAHARLRRSL
jgi:hypothetical protein